MKNKRNTERYENIWNYDEWKIDLREFKQKIRVLKEDFRNVKEVFVGKGF